MYPCSGWDVVGSESSIVYCCTVDVSGCQYVHPARPCMIATSLWMLSGMYMGCSQCFWYVSVLWLVQNRVLVVVGLLYVRTYGCACLSVFFSRDICYIYLIYAMVDLLVYISSVNLFALLIKLRINLTFKKSLVDNH